MRRKGNYKKERKPDLKYGNVAVGRFINYLMQDGKKSNAERIMYDTFDIIQKEAKTEPVKVLEQALENAAPAVEVVSKRVGGANYQVPREVRAERKQALAFRWILNAARGGKGKPMAQKLAQELMNAANNEGSAIKKKEDVLRMAEANKAFAHFAW